MCINFSDIRVFNVENAILGIRNAKKSWNKSDSKWGDFEDSEYEKSVALSGFDYHGKVFEIGEEDYKLALNLVKAGSDHRKFLRQIFVSMNITAPSYWWRQFDTYKVGVTQNSTSQMHTITNRKLTKDDFEYITTEHLEHINNLITIYQATGSKKIKRRLIQMMPASYLYTRTVSLNYEVLRNQYHSRKNHFLEEWKFYCKFLHYFPYSDFITVKGR